MASSAAVAAALARMDARIEPAHKHTPIVTSSPAPMPTPRRGPLHLGQPKCPDAPRGVCRWCGEPIVLVEGADYRRARRRYHYGDEHEVGDRDCLSKWRGSVVWDARGAVRTRELDAHGVLFCADCGEVVYRPPERSHHDTPYHRLPRHERPDLLPLDHPIQALYRAYERPWECDHRIPLEDGGPHHMDNLQVLCVPCHRAKTARENAARREARRVDKAQAAA